ncbi:MAG: aminopeptidase P family protein [Clostridia bacterium]|nr:aminopeptidase P family protein [Clostridia bacterium]
MKIFPLSEGQCCFFEDRLNRLYCSGVDIAEGYFLLSDSSVYYTDARYFSAAKIKLEKAGITALLYKSADDITQYIASKNVKTVFIDFSKITLTRFEELKSIFGGAEIKDCKDVIEGFRAVKTEEEIACTEKACIISQKAVEETLSYAREGITEKELLKYLEEITFLAGGEGMAFDTIVAFGANSAVPHHETGNTKLKYGDAVLIDTGCKVNGYCSDITRTAFFGKPDKDFLSVYDAVLRANLKAEKEIVSGMSGKAADRIARDELCKAGYGEYFTHSLGHGVGLEIHENPRLSPRSNDILTENAVFTVEPGVYFDGKFGVRIEDTCVMTAAGAKRLFDDDKKLRILSRKK